MTTGGLLMCVPMLGLLAWAAAVDLRTRRIPNWLTCSLALAGLLLSVTWARTSEGPVDAMLGLLAGFAIGFALFGLGAWGGGDVKVLSAVGAWFGPMPVLIIFATAALISMTIALVQAAAQGRLAALFRNATIIATSLAYSGDGGLEQAAETGRACSSPGKRIPYAVSLLLATLLTLTWM
jgi:prepilin peptidase CpaA